MRPDDRARGFVLVSVAVTIAIIGVLAFYAANQSAINVNATGSEIEATRADYVAHAGLQHGLRQTAQQGCGPFASLSNVPIGSDKYSTSLTAATGATSFIKAAVDQDGWIRDDNPSDTHPGDAKLHFRSDGVIERPVYRYDLSAVPAQASIVSARAYFYLVKEHPEGPVDIHALQANWTEDDASWDLLGDAMDAQVQATIPTQPTSGVWVSVNLTPLVQAWVNGHPNVGITLNSRGDGAHGEYASKESGNAPYLDVIVGTPPSSQAKLKAVGTLANGISRVLSREVTLQDAAPGHYEIQPGPTDGSDAYLDPGDPNRNEGSSQNLRVQDGDDHSVIRFSVAGIPYGAAIGSATLDLYQRETAKPAGVVDVHRLTRSFDEDEVTWNRYRDGNNWTNAGGDYDPRSVASTSIPANTAGHFQWDITEMVQGWVSGTYANQGLILLPGSPGTDLVFHSSDVNTASERPKLTVTYRCQCGTVCVAPKGNGGRIVMIGNWAGSLPDPRDLEKEAMFESWGYEVDQADDSFIWFINFSNYDLAYVSETSQSGSIGTQLTNRSIGVINEEPNLLDELGMAAAEIEKVGSSIDIVDSNHYITQPFADGLRAVYAGGMEFISLNGPAPGLQVLGEFDGNASLAVLDAGAETIGGGGAAGRRVTLPVGQYGNADFDWTYVNGDGRLLVQRSIEWAMGNDGVTIGNVLLVVDDESNLTSQEFARKAIIESWNYQVSLITASDSQAAYDAAVAANDVVYVPEDVLASDVNDKLLSAPVGVVIEEGNLVDDFGIAGGNDWGSGTEIDIVDSSHYITQPLGSGIVSMYTTAEDQLRLTPGLSPDLRSLATSASGGSTLATLETGASLLGGGASAGRRVVVPWGGNAMDINHLDDNGLIVFRRAIEWSAGAELPGPIAHWKLDETSGVTAFDSEGGHDGTLAGDASWAAGMRQGALSLDGSGDNVSVPHHEALSLSSFSIAAWTRATRTDRVMTILSKSSGTEHNFFLNQYYDDFLCMFSNGTDEIVSTMTDSVTADQWYHVVCTYDEGSDLLSLFVDGSLVASTNTSGDPLPNNAPVHIGGQSAQPYWSGSLDDVRIYDRALAAGEIAELARKPGPIAHWKLDDASGGTAVDSVGGHDGTLYNGPAWSTGQMDGALTFDGNDDYVDLSSDSELDDVFLGGATVTAWIYLDSWGESDYGRILDKSSATAGQRDGWMIGTDGNNETIAFAQGFTSERGFWRPQEETVNLNEWVHYAIVYDAGSTTNDPVIYLNGIAQTSLVEIPPEGTIRSDADISLHMGNHAQATSRTLGGKLDDVRIYDRLLDASEIAELAATGGGGGGGSGGGGDCSGIFRDDFDSVSWNGSVGTLSWSGPWAEVGESDGPGSGDVQIRNDVSNYQLRIRDNNNDGEGVERVADLSGATTATLSFDYRRQSLDSSSDYVAVYASANGTSGPWTELPGPRIQGGTNDSTYQPWSRDISAFISANTAIRLRGSPSLGGTDTVYFDNLQIACSP